MEESFGRNWAAFFFSGLWFPYRKMYKATFILWSLIILESVVEHVVFLEVLGYENLPRGWETFSTAVVAALCGAFANKWYFRFVQKKLRTLQAAGLSDTEYKAQVQRTGGTSILSMLIPAVILISVICFLSFAENEISQMPTPATVQKVNRL